MFTLSFAKTRKRNQEMRNGKGVVPEMNDVKRSVKRLVVYVSFQRFRMWNFHMGVSKGARALNSLKSIENWENLGKFVKIVFVYLVLDTCLIQLEPCVMYLTLAVLQAALNLCLETP